MALSHEQVWQNDGGWRVLRILGIATVACFFLVSFTPLSDALNRWTRVPEQLQPAAAIVVLGGGMEGGGVLSNSSLRRMIHGIVLFQRGLAPVLAFSGPASRRHGLEEARVRAEMARLFGVSPFGIVTETSARTTREEAIRMAALLQPMGAYRVLLVTSDAHMARSRALFEKVGFLVQPAPVDDASDVWKPEGRLRSMRQMTQEWLAHAYYRLAGYL
jgi:uncharacterized SAM-binding protein YcdF (DUF218 family)